jgi:hypothetical protein
MNTDHIDIWIYLGPGPARALSGFWRTWPWGTCGTWDEPSWDVEMVRGHVGDDFNIWEEEGMGFGGLVTTRIGARLVPDCTRLVPDCCQTGPEKQLPMWRIRGGAEGTEGPGMMGLRGSWGVDPRDC